MTGVQTCALPISNAPLRLLLACAGALALVSLWDDLRSLPIQVRLPAHFAAAIVAVLALGPLDGARPALDAVEALFAVVALVWMTNLFNFMDGSDGLAGGMAAIGFGTLSWAALQAGAAPLAFVSAALASASLGSLRTTFRRPASFSAMRARCRWAFSPARWDCTA